MKQTAVDYLIHEYFGDQLATSFKKAYNKAVEMQTSQSEDYAEFCVMCDREGLPLIRFNDYVTKSNQIK
jgi:hypothetical protein